VVNLKGAFGARLVVFALLSILAGWGLSIVSESFLASRWNFEDSWVVEMLETGEPVQKDLEGATGFEGWNTETTEIKVRFLSGNFRGTEAVASVEHLKDSRLVMRPGLTYILSYNEFDDGSRMFFVSDVFRAPAFAGLFAGAVVFFCLVTGITGIRAIVGLFLSFLVLVKFLLPGLLKGYPPQVLGIAAVAGVALVTVVTVLRRRRCWLPAFSGALGGCVSAILFGWFSVGFLHLSGLSTESASILASTIPGLDLRGILLASIMIGASGAVLDVAVSVTSAMAEIKDHDPGITAGGLFRSGINVGREVLGSMVNTLVFAYFGNSLVLSLLILEAEPVPIALLNDAVVVEEIVRALAGTAGLLLTVPLTAMFGALASPVKTQPAGNAGN
jgi:uncharacterized membrane protein